MPVAQILFAGVAAFVLRANLPVAALATLISNPFTIVPLYVFAYHVGVALLGTPVEDVSITSLASNFPGSPAAIAPWVNELAEVATPLYTGLGTMAVAGALCGYVLVQIVWLAPAVWRASRRRPHATPRP